MSQTLKNIEATACDQCESAHQSIFCVLNKLERSKLSEEKSYNYYKKGQTIFNEGNHPQGLYCIFSGKVKIHKLSNAGNEQIFRLVKKGRVIGCHALLSNDKFNASATAIEDSVICYFPKSVYQEQIALNPSLAIQLIKVLSAELKSVEKMAINLVQKNVKERVSETLLVLSDFFGLEEDNATIKTSLTRENIGNMAGTTTETTIRVLSDLQKNNIVELIGKKIKIKNTKELIRVANILE